MTEQEERYVHFVSCISALNNAWRLICSIKEQQGLSNSLIGAAFRYALIEYSKPYTESRGTVKKKWRLDTTHVPQDMQDLHKRITDARDQVHAHSDLTVMDAKILMNEIRDMPPLISQNIISGLEELKNIDAIQRLIEATLENMYEEEKRLVPQLPCNLIKNQH
jgi:hypothetical protein